MKQPSAIATKIARYGVWGPMAWFSWSNTHLPDLAGIHVWFHPYFWFSVTMAVVVALGLLKVGPRAVQTVEAGKRFERTARTLDRACLAAMLLSCLLLVAPELRGMNADVAYLGSSLAGLAVGWSYIRWASHLSRHSLRSLIGCVFVGSILWTCARAVYYPLPLIPSMLCAMAIAAFSHIALRTAHASHRENEDGRPAVEAAGDAECFAAWRFWAVIVAVTVVAQLLVGETSAHFRGAGSIAYPLKALASLALYCVLLYWTLKTKLPFDFVLLWRSLLMLAAGALVAVALLDSDLVTWILPSIATDMLIPITWLTTCAIAHRSALPPALAVATGLGAYGVSSFAGIALGKTVPPLMGSASLSALLLFVLLVVFALCLDSRNPDLPQLFEDLRGKTIRRTDFPNIAEACARIGGEHRLTPREIEVMEMLCMGRSRSYVAETLYISENTVKTHIDRLYRKLGVHSREELQDAIGL